MENNILKNGKDYVFCVEKQNKDGFSFEAKARSVYSGNFYDVRFEGKKRFAFFICKNNQWFVYYLEKNSEYCPSAFKSAEAFIRLENDIKCGLEKPYLFVHGNKVKKYRLRGDAKIILPNPPFLFQTETEKLDDELQKNRYNYKTPPKYIIAARKTKYVKPGEADSLYFFGCNNNELYKKISYGMPICVTHTYENEKAVAVLKFANKYDIIPFQHCLKVL